MKAVPSVINAVRPFPDRHHSRMFSKRFSLQPKCSNRLLRQWFSLLLRFSNLLTRFSSRSFRNRHRQVSRLHSRRSPFLLNRSDQLPYLLNHQPE